MTLKNNTINIWNWLSLSVLALVAGSEIRLLWQLRKLNMLPGNLYWILCGVCLILTGLLCLLLFRRKPRGKWQKRAGCGKQIVGYLFSAVVIGGCWFGSSAVGKVQNTVTSITAPQKVNVVLEIYVRSDDSAQYLQDTAGYTFAVPEDISSAEVATVIEELVELLGGDLKTAAYANTTAQMDALFSGEVDALVLDSAYLGILEELDAYADYADKIRLLDERIVEKEIPQTTAPPETEPAPDQTEGPEKTGFLVYVSGIDSRSRVNTNSRSDVNILMAVNPETHQVLLVNTPRDYYVINPASGDNSLDKLTHCGIQGTENSMKSLSLLYGQKAEYYARVNFSGFERLVDAIGGVTVFSNVAFTTHDGHFIQKGTNYLNGQQALGFARTRKALKGGDNDRGKNQMKLIAAIIDKLSASTILNNYTQILDSMEGMFSTSVPAELIGELVQTQISQRPDWEIFTFAVTGDGGHDLCWASGWISYVTYPHEDVVEHAAGLIGKVLYGEILTDADMTVNP